MVVPLSRQTALTQGAKHQYASCLPQSPCVVWGKWKRIKSSRDDWRSKTFGKMLMFVLSSAYRLSCYHKWLTPGFENESTCFLLGWWPSAQAWINCCALQYLSGGCQGWELSGSAVQVVHISPVIIPLNKQRDQVEEWWSYWQVRKKAHVLLQYMWNNKDQPSEGSFCCSLSCQLCWVVSACEVEDSSDTK